ncbi:hypothetical protein PV04_06446 [Phialophora macrospora]|uniref:SNF2 N-terminal domain-containing protein n=1 Tax=Phialophora macrospora TaxID=1851006 RepID=A0A0D2FK87_9EURO|nr:hypothetical protein PV04_06446 [Phialophora macrospora]
MSADVNEGPGSASYTEAKLRAGEDADTRPTFVVCPSPVLPEWLKEIDRYFTGILNGHIFYGSERDEWSTRHQSMLLSPDLLQARGEIKP